MAEIEAILDDIKKGGTSGKILSVGLLCVIGLLVYNLVKGNNGSNSTYIVPTGYTSYPDAVTNANVIIDEVNKNDNYNTSVILDKMKDNQDNIDDQFSKTNDLISEKFDATNDYINNGFDALGNKIDTGLGDIGEDIANINDNIGKLQGSVNTNYNVLNNLKETAKSVKESYTNIERKKGTQFYEKTTYKGVSLVDGLKSIGVIDDQKNIKAIAEVNGVKNYTGTANQNAYLLRKLKAGILKRA